MLYNQFSKLQIGRHKGHTLSQVYQFDPSYLEWLIEFISDFEIDLEEFRNLPNPTPLGQATLQMKENHRGTLNFQIDSVIPIAQELISEGHYLKSIDFKFSEKACEILYRKNAGIYKTPEYKPVTFKSSDFISIEELFD